MYRGHGDDVTGDLCRDLPGSSPTSRLAGSFSRCLSLEAATPAYSVVPNKHVDRLICGKPFSHRRQTYLEHFFNQKSVAWEKKWTTYAVFYLNCAGAAIL